jgi:hypothetical protein
MRYVVALVIAGIIIVAALLAARQSIHGVEERIRDHLRQRQQAGAPDLQGVDIDSMRFNDFQMTLPTSELYRLKLGQLVLRTWHVWAPAVAVICLLAAVLVGFFRSRRPPIT